MEAANGPMEVACCSLAPSALWPPGGTEEARGLWSRQAVQRECCGLYAQRSCEFKRAGLTSPPRSVRGSLPEGLDHASGMHWRASATPPPLEAWLPLWGLAGHAAPPESGLGCFPRGSLRLTPVFPHSSMPLSRRTERRLLRVGSSAMFDVLLGGRSEEEFQRSLHLLHHTHKCLGPEETLFLRTG